MKRSDMIRYFDLVAHDNVDEKLAKRLGYYKVFNSGEIKVAGTPGPDIRESYIVYGRDAGTLRRAIRKPNVLGVMIEDSELLKKVVDELGQAGKLLCFNASELTCVDQKTRMRNLYRMRGLYRFAVKSGAKTAIFTLAKDRHCMLSAMQMLEIAKLIGAGEKDAKAALGAIGDLYHN